MLAVETLYKSSKEPQRFLLQLASSPGLPSYLVLPVWQYIYIDIYVHIYIYIYICIDNLLVRIYFVIEVIWWTGLAQWEFEFPFPGSLTSTFLCPPTWLWLLGNKVPISLGLGRGTADWGPA